MNHPATCALWLSTLLLIGCGGRDGALTCSEPEVLEGRLTGNVVVGERCSNWLVRGSVTVPEGATLTLRPGVTLSFLDDTGLVVDGGAIHAVGTAEEPILLTGTTRAPGAWAGVHLARSNATRNRFEHVRIEWAGGSKFSTAGAAAALALSGSAENPSRIQITDSEFSHSAGYGISLDAWGELPGFSRNRLAENALGSAHVHPASVGGLTPGNAFGDGGTASAIHVQDGTLTGREATFHELGAPFVVGSIELRTGATLVLDPGVELRMRAGKQLRAVEGVIRAVGTAEKGISVRGEEATPGYWVGIVIHASEGENALAHVTISDAGGARDSWALAAATVALTDDSARLSLVDSTIRNGASFGLYLDGNAALTQFERNTFSQHALGAAYVQARGAHQLGGDNAYADNARAFVWVDGSDAVNADVTWASLDVPYFVASDLRVEGHLTVAPGASLHFDADAALIVPNTGRLTAVGTADAPITFARSPEVAAWKGLWLHASKHDNRLEHAVVSGAGAAASSWSSGNPAGLMVYQSKVNVAGARFADNTGYGVWVSTLSEASGCSAATFSGNTIAATGGAPCP